MLRRYTTLTLLALVVSASLIGKPYKPISDGNWPYESNGIRFSPNITDNWKYSLTEGPSNYEIYFTREGTDSVPYLEAGGIQCNPVFTRFAGRAQFKTYILAIEGVQVMSGMKLTEYTIEPDSTFGEMCLRFTRVFVPDTSGGATVIRDAVRDEGYYFIHPKNPRSIYRVHLYRESVDAAGDRTFRSYMNLFYRKLTLDGNFVPLWTFGVNYSGGFGTTSGLSFGYVDAETGTDITVDPGAGFGLGLITYRRLRNVFVVGTEIGFSSASSLSSTYANLSAKTNRGCVIEATGGALLLSRFRHRVLLNVGPVLYTNPAIKIDISDAAGPGNVHFVYGPAVGLAFNAHYVAVSKRKRGQLVFGFKYHYIGYKLKEFNSGGQTYQPSDLNPLFGNFKSPDASNFALVFIGYQYTLN